LGKGGKIGAPVEKKSRAPSHFKAKEGILEGEKTNRIYGH